VNGDAISVSNNTQLSSRQGPEASASCREHDRKSREKKAQSELKKNLKARPKEIWKNMEERCGAGKRWKGLWLGHRGNYLIRVLTRLEKRLTEREGGGVLVSLGFLDGGGRGTIHLGPYYHQGGVNGKTTVQKAEDGGLW